MAEEAENKLADFQEITGLQDLLLCHQVLQDHNWDLEAAVSSILDLQTLEQEQQNGAAFAAASSSWDWSATDEQAREEEPERFSSGGATSTASSDRSSFRNNPNLYGDGAAYHHHPLAVEHSNSLLRPFDTDAEAHDDGVWRLVDLPLSIVRGSYNLMSDAVGLGMGMAGGMLNYSMDVLGLRGDRSRHRRQDISQEVFTPASEVASFIQRFEREYGVYHPQFQRLSFLQALRYAERVHKFLFVYIHSPEHLSTPGFCKETLCHQVVVEFLNENFVSWGGEVLSSEGYQMSKSLKIASLPFCAIVTSAPNAQIAVVQQVEGSKSAGELLSIIQGVVEEHGAAFSFAQDQEEEHQDHIRLRQEQDVAYQIGLQADQEREERQLDEAARISREEEVAEYQRREIEEAAAWAAQEAAEKEAALERRHRKRAITLLTEPEKGPNVTQVLLRLPTGERIQHRFESSAKVGALYDYVDSFGTVGAGKFSLVSNFPRIVYGPDKMDLTLRDAGLHPNASLFVQLN